MANKEKLIGRIRYAKNCMDFEECYIYEYKSENETEWTFESAYPIVDGTVHFSAITHIQKWQRMGINFRCLW